MEKQDSLDFGQRLVVASLILVLLVEIVLCYLGILRGFWFGAMLEGLFVLAALAMANGVYSGREDARGKSLLWITLQLIISLTGLAVLAADKPLEVSSYLGITSPWWGIVKFLSYLGLGSLLFYSNTVKAFLGVKGGKRLEELNLPLDSLVVPTGTNVPLTKEQIQAVDNLAGSLKAVSITLFVVAGIKFAQLFLQGYQLRTLAEAVLILSLGAIMILPTRSLKMVSENGPDVAYIMNAVRKLSGMFSKKIIVLTCLLVLVGFFFVTR